MNGATIFGLCCVIKALKLNRSLDFGDLKFIKRKRIQVKDNKVCCREQAERAEQNMDLS